MEGALLWEGVDENCLFFVESDFQYNSATSAVSDSLVGRVDGALRIYVLSISNFHVRVELTPQLCQNPHSQNQARYCEVPEVTF